MDYVLKGHYMSCKEVKPWFDVCAGSAVFLLGVVLVIKYFFFTSDPNAYSLVFGLQFITAGVLLVHGKFRGFSSAENGR